MWEQNSLHRGKKTTTITTSERKTFDGRKITLHISHPRHQTNICNASDASKWCAWCCVGIWVVELKCTTILIVLCAYSNANGAALDWKVSNTHTQHQQQQQHTALMFLNVLLSCCSNIPILFIAQIRHVLKFITNAQSIAISHSIQISSGWGWASHTFNSIRSALHLLAMRYEQRPESHFSTLCHFFKWHSA